MTEGSGGWARIADWAFTLLVSATGCFLAIGFARWLLPASVDRLAWPLGLLIAVVIPLAIDRWLTRRYRRLQSAAAGTQTTTLVVWNGALVGAIVLFAPVSAKAALPSVLTALATDLHMPSRPVTTIAERVFRATEPREVEANDADGGSAAAAVDAGSFDAAADAASITRVSLTEPIAVPSSGGPAAMVFRTRAPVVVVIHTVEPLESTGMAPVLRDFGMKWVRASGSGFVAASDSKKSLIVTNHHVAGGATALRVVLKDGRAFDRARVVADSQDDDLALVEIDVGDLPIAPLAANDDVTPGARAIAIGAPLGLDYTLTEGIVSARRQSGRTTLLQTQTTINHGSSGGPLFDEGGDVIGVNTATKGPGLNLAVSAKHVRALLAAPRLNRVLAHYTPGPTLRELTIEGATLSAIDRLSVEESCTEIFALMERCLDESSASAAYEIRVAPPDGGDLPAAMAALFGNGAARGHGFKSSCFDDGNARFFAGALGLQLRQAMGASVEHGGVVSIVFEVAAADGGAPKQLGLRYVFSG